MKFELIPHPPVVYTRNVFKIILENFETGVKELTLTSSSSSITTSMHGVLITLKSKKNSKNFWDRPEGPMISDFPNGFFEEFHRTFYPMVRVDSERLSALLDIAGERLTFKRGYGNLIRGHQFTYTVGTSKWRQEKRIIRPLLAPVGARFVTNNSAGKVATPEIWTKIDDFSRSKSLREFDMKAWLSSHGWDNYQVDGQSVDEQSVDEQSVDGNQQQDNLSIEIRYMQGLSRFSDEQFEVFKGLVLEFLTHKPSLVTL
jgi:hypothetical protein